MKERATGNTFVRYPRNEVPEGATDWARLAAMTEEEIEAGALSDPDNPPLTDAQLDIGALTLPGERRKIPVSIRLDLDVLEYYRSGGPGYQTRINDDLRALVGRRQRSLRKRAADLVRRPRSSKVPPAQ
jgi:uncharacterized protein (DUF4415 family)